MRLATVYAAFFCCAFSFAQRACWNAAIFRRAAADIVRFTGDKAVVLPMAPTGSDPFFALAHLAFCARAILPREAADMIRVGWFVCPKVTWPKPLSEIACFLVQLLGRISFLVRLVGVLLA